MEFAVREIGVVSSAISVPRPLVPAESYSWMNAVTVSEPVKSTSPSDTWMDVTS